MDFRNVLTTFARAFEEGNIRYALVGGLAVHAWGRTRPTRDADFAVDLSAKAAVLSITESLGYATIFSSEVFSNHQHEDPAWGHVDVMYLSGRTADAIFAAAVSRPVLGEQQLPVASPEHLAMMKALAMKNFPHRALYEGEDVRALLALDGVDRASIREYFERHGMLDLFDAIEKAG